MACRSVRCRASRVVQAHAGRAEPIENSQQEIRLVAVIMAVFSLTTLATPARAAEFRIHTKVYANGGKTPAGENITIFRDGLVYDFCQDPAEAVVFDPAGGRFVLLEPRRQQMAEIGLERIDTLLPALQQRLA